MPVIAVKQIPPANAKTVKAEISPINVEKAQGNKFIFKKRVLIGSILGGVGTASIFIIPKLITSRYMQRKSKHQEELQGKNNDNLKNSQTHNFNSKLKEGDSDEEDDEVLYSSLPDIVPTEIVRLIKVLPLDLLRRAKSRSDLYSFGGLFSSYFALDLVSPDSSLFLKDLKSETKSLAPEDRIIHLFRQISSFLGQFGSNKEFCYSLENDPVIKKIITIYLKVIEKLKQVLNQKKIKKIKKIKPLHKQEISSDSSSSDSSECFSENEPTKQLLSKPKDPIEQPLKKKEPVVQLLPEQKEPVQLLTKPKEPIEQLPPKPEYIQENSSVPTFLVEEEKSQEPSIQLPPEQKEPVQLLPEPKFMQSTFLNYPLPEKVHRDKLALRVGYPNFIENPIKYLVPSFRNYPIFWFAASLQKIGEPVYYLKWPFKSSSVANFEGQFIRHEFIDELYEACDGKKLNIPGERSFENGSTRLAVVSVLFVEALNALLSGDSAACKHALSYLTDEEISLVHNMFYKFLVLNQSELDVLFCLVPSALQFSLFTNIKRFEEIILSGSIGHVDSINLARSLLIITKNNEIPQECIDFLIQLILKSEEKFKNHISTEIKLILKRNDFDIDCVKQEVYNKDSSFKKELIKFCRKIYCKRNEFHDMPESLQSIIATIQQMRDDGEEPWGNQPEDNNTIAQWFSWNIGLSKKEIFENQLYYQKTPVTEDQLRNFPKGTGLPEEPGEHNVAQRIIDKLWNFKDKHQSYLWFGGTDKSYIALSCNLLVFLEHLYDGLWHFNWKRCLDGLSGSGMTDEQMRQQALNQYKSMKYDVIGFDPGDLIHIRNKEQFTDFNDIIYLLLLLTNEQVKEILPGYFDDRPYRQIFKLLDFFRFLLGMGVPIENITKLAAASQDLKSWKRVETIPMPLELPQEATSDSQEVNE